MMVERVPVAVELELGEVSGWWSASVVLSTPGGVEVVSGPTSYAGSQHGAMVDALRTFVAPPTPDDGD